MPSGSSASIASAAHSHARGSRRTRGTRERDGLGASASASASARVKAKGEGLGASSLRTRAERFRDTLQPAPRTMGIFAACRVSASRLRRACGSRGTFVSFRDLFVDADRVADCYRRNVGFRYLPGDFECDDAFLLVDVSLAVLTPAGPGDAAEVGISVGMPAVDHLALPLDELSEDGTHRKLIDLRGDVVVGPGGRCAAVVSTARPGSTALLAADAMTVPEVPVPRSPAAAGDGDDDGDTDDESADYDDYYEGDDGVEEEGGYTGEGDDEASRDGGFLSGEPRRPVGPPLLHTSNMSNGSFYESAKRPYRLEYCLPDGRVELKVKNSVHYPASSYAAHWAQATGARDAGVPAGKSGALSADKPGALPSGEAVDAGGRIVVTAEEHVRATYSFMHRHYLYRPMDFDTGGLVVSASADAASGGSDVVFWLRLNVLPIVKKVPNARFVPYNNIQAHLLGSLPLRKR